MAFNFTSSEVVPADEMASLIQLASDYRATRSIWIGSLAVLMFDYLLTVRDEIRYLRNGRFGWIKVLFLTNRYWNMMNHILDNTALSVVHPPQLFCRFFFNWFTYAAIVTHISIGSILMLRIYAMYNRNKYLLWGLITLLTLELIAETAIIGPITFHMKIIQPPLGLQGCILNNDVSYTYAYWIPMIGFETVVFTLAVIKCVQVARAETDTPRVLMVLLRDSVGYFGGVLAVIVSNCVTWSLRSSLFGVTLGAAFATHSILGCRMLLNIHHAVRPNWYDAETSIWDSSMGRPETQNPPTFRMRRLDSRPTPKMMITVDMDTEYQVD